MTWHPKIAITHGVENFVWKYALSWVICSCIHCWGDGLMSNVRQVWTLHDDGSCIGGDDLELIWYHMHLDESRALHTLLVNWNALSCAWWLSCLLIFDIIKWLSVYDTPFVVNLHWWYRMIDNVVNTYEYLCDMLLSFLVISFILNAPACFVLNYDDVMLTLSGSPPAFPYGRVDGVQDA